jgi:hypothetical protein
LWACSPFADRSVTKMAGRPTPDTSVTGVAAGRGQTRRPAAGTRGPSG